MNHNEDIYFFSHAILQEAAYQLSPPSVRARLHSAATEMLTALPEPPAVDIARHARLAREGVTQFDDTLLKLERYWTERAASEAEKSYRTFDGIRLLQRLAQILRPESLEQAGILCRLASLWIEVNRISEAIPLAEQALTLGERLNDVRLQATACSAIAAACRDSVRNAESGMYYRRARKLFEQIGDREGLCKAALGLAGTLWVQGALEEAEQVALLACELSEDTNDISAAAGAWMNRLGIALQSGNFDEAKRTIERLNDITKETTQPVLLMRLHSFRAYAHDIMGNKAGAREEYNLSMQLAQQTGNMTEVARCQTNLALLDASERRFAQAHERHAAAERIAREQGDLRIVAYACAGQSQIDCCLGDLRSGLERIYAAIRIARTIGMGGITETWCVTAGLIEAELGDVHAARELLENLGNFDDATSATIRLAVLAVIESRTGAAARARELAAHARNALPEGVNAFDPPAKRWVEMALALLR